MKGRYIKDDAETLFLGIYKEFDLWGVVNEETKELITVVGRYGEGADYQSGIVFAIKCPEDFPHLKLAYDRAKKLGYTSSLYSTIGI